MTFQPGDLVRVVTAGSRYAARAALDGQTGTVVAVDEVGSWPVIVHLDSDERWAFPPDELEVR